MERLHVQIECIIEDPSRLVMPVTATWKGDPISLSLGAFMTFLMQHEKEMAPEDVEFGYVLPKYLKKVQVGPQFHMALVEDWDQAFFFEKVIEYQVPLKWTYQGQTSPVKINTPLPISIQVSKKKKSLVC
ncbi:MAG: hypothetical protein HRT90_07870, partial [Candidatus Margulisbacteria bacterium]|nr:hypothetical protein [Candidatus Margulisiibacteriota bacterium]